jgi:hypothetical protein
MLALPQLVDLADGAYIKEFGFFFFLRMAVAVSSTWRLLVFEAFESVGMWRVVLTALTSLPEASL